jgi:hypothetical protein
MECASTVEVGDLVYLHPSTPNTVVTAEDNNTPSPIIGIVISKYSDNNAKVLVSGIIKISTVIDNGRLFVGLGGGISPSCPMVNYSQEIGRSFGDGVIDFAPVYRRVKRSA